MEDLLLRARVVARISKLYILRRRLADYAEKLLWKACRTIIFPHLTNQIVDLRRCRGRCQSKFFNSLLVQWRNLSFRCYYWGQLKWSIPPISASPRALLKRMLLGTLSVCKIKPLTNLRSRDPGDICQTSTFPSPLMLITWEQVKVFFPLIQERLHRWNEFWIFQVFLLVTLM